MASFVLAAATVFFLIMGFSNLWGNRDEAENLIGHQSPMNAYVYLDAVACDILPPPIEAGESLLAFS